MGTEVEEQLNKVADLIETKGHYQGGEVPLDGRAPVCILTGLNQIVVDPEPGMYEVARRIGIVDGEDISMHVFQRVYDWNDQTPTAEVLRALRGE